jgi:hypothetical protein
MTELNICIGDTIVVKDNLADELNRLDFDEMDIPDFCNHFVGTSQKVYAVWTDKLIDEKFVTIDLCVEIPIASCELV